jgi:tRNA A-37 threonylcarbamoyl transferase component Bud32
MTAIPSDFRELPDRYIIISEIGSGGAGAVLKARDTLLDKIVAIKILKRSMLPDTVALQRFHMEAKAASRLNHDGIVRVLDFGFNEASGSAYLVMEYSNGQTLSQLVASRGSLPPALALDLTKQIARAMSHAHTRGVIHRDLKPSNVLLEIGSNERFSVKVTDFGIAKITGTDEKLTQFGALVGTPKYLSPEQASASDVTPSSDVYSLGCLLFECLTGEAPFIGDSYLETIAMHKSARPRDLQESGFSPELASFVDKLLEKDPDDRYQTMDDVLQAIENMEKPSTDSTSARNTEKKKVSSYTTPFFLIGGLAILVLGPAIFVVLYLSHNERNADATAPNYEFGHDKRMALGNYDDIDPHRNLVDEALRIPGRELLYHADNEFIDDEYVEEVLPRLYGLRELIVPKCKLNDKSLPVIGRKRLSKLILTNQPISDLGISKLRGMSTLRELDLSGSQITDAGIVSLSELKNLKVLYLKNSRVSEAGLNHLKQALPFCQVYTDRAYKPTKAEQRYP